MKEEDQKLNQLQERLEFLLARQESYLKEIYVLKSELLTLREEAQSKTVEVDHLAEPTVQDAPAEQPLELGKKGETTEAVNKGTERQDLLAKLKHIESTKPKTDLERFIGENLMSKVGIAITVIGVAIGAKYAIDNQLISPLARILLGYLVGLSLFVFSFRLKKEYKNFSAVLLSGAMAIFYFITFAAYSFYGLLPQPFAFALMLLFTGFTVVASLRYNEQVIALYGMVGAYAIPFLLSNDTGQIAILYTYITIINVGILILAFKKYWQILYYASFILTWLIFAGWFEQRYDWEVELGIGFGFLTLFFLLFYATFLAYKVVQKEQFGIRDVFLLLANSFIFYGYGYAMIEGQPDYSHLVGVFTLINAAIHFGIVGFLIRVKRTDKNLISFITGLILIFVTISIPVQLDGSWVTLLWVFQAALLFWIGRAKSSPVYEKLAYPLMLLACLSLVHDWVESTNTYYSIQDGDTAIAFFNIQFLTSLLFVGAFGFINSIHLNTKYSTDVFKSRNWSAIVSIGIPLVLIASTFFTFRIEIMSYWDHLFFNSGRLPGGAEFQFDRSIRNDDLVHFQTVSLICYSLVFVGVLAFVNLKKFKDNLLGGYVLLFGVAAILVFLTQGLFVLSILREHYLTQSSSALFVPGLENLWVRYVAFIPIVGLFWLLHRQILSGYSIVKVTIPFELFLFISILWILSSELIHWMDITDVKHIYKLGLSIFWGVFSLAMVGYGIWKEKKYLRVAAMVLFGATLSKLFLYDIAGMDTISKTIVFVALGVLLLIISFLYNRYKGFLFNKEQE